MDADADDVDTDYDFAFHLQLEDATSATLSLQPSTSTSFHHGVVFDEFAVLKSDRTTEDDWPDLGAAATIEEPISREGDLHPYAYHYDGDNLSFIEYSDGSVVPVSAIGSDNNDIISFNRKTFEYARHYDVLNPGYYFVERSGGSVLPVCDDSEDYGEDEDHYLEYQDGENGGEVFRVYFKGLVEKCSGSAAIGVAICNSRDELVFEMRKPLPGGSETSRQCVEIKALTEGLNAAITLDLERVTFFCDYRPVYQFVTGRWPVKQRKVATLVNQVAVLRRKFLLCQPYLVARNEIKFAFKFAREAMLSQIKSLAESTAPRNVYETCVICLEDTEVLQIFSVDGCMHRYCFSCMNQHVEVKLLHGIVPKCPHDECNSDLKLDSCSKFLTPKLIDTMKQRIREASIPVTERVYCPYPKCSALMSKSEVLEYSRSAFLEAERSGARICTKCNGQFCINCKVPWHNMTCSEYKMINPDPPEDVKLKNLAARNFWRQCVKCNHIIELATGCYHMTCRCGYEFCYSCGAEWKDKRATCVCKLWDEDGIIDTDEDEFDVDFDVEFDLDDYYDFGYGYDPDHLSIF